MFWLGCFHTVEFDLSEGCGGQLSAWTFAVLREISLVKPALCNLNSEGLGYTVNGKTLAEDFRGLQEVWRGLPQQRPRPDSHQGLVSTRLEPFARVYA